jgi:hypothetical protein
MQNAKIKIEKTPQNMKTKTDETGKQKTSGLINKNDESQGGAAKIGVYRCRYDDDYDEHGEGGFFSSGNSPDGADKEELVVVKVLPEVKPSLWCKSPLDSFSERG